MRVYAAERMDSIGNTQWVVPDDQGTEASMVCWEKAPRQEQRGGRWRQPKDPVLHSHHEGCTATERGCISVSPRTKVEDVGVEAFPRSGFQSRHSQRQSFEIGTALEAMGDSEGPEVDGLRAALEKAKEFAEGVLLEKQIKDGEQFLIRAKGHLVEFEKERNTVEASIADAERRLEKLRAQADLLHLRHHCSHQQVLLQCREQVASWRGPVRHRSVLACANEFLGLQEVGLSQ